jgi:hypothetical protein
MEHIDLKMDKIRAETREALQQQLIFIEESTYNNMN